MRLAFVLVIAAACGGSPPSQKPHPRRGGSTCDDAAILLRGDVSAESKRAVKAKDRAIVDACVEGEWSPKVLGCMTRAAHADDCLDHLTTAQLDAYNAKLEHWRDRYPPEVPAEDDEPAKPPPEVACDDAIGTEDATAHWTPAISGDVYASAIRRLAIVAQCRTQAWSAEVRACMESGKDTVDDCRADLEESQAKALTDKLAEIDKLNAAAAALKPAAITCAKVGAGNKKVTAESRKKLIKSCTDEKWSAQLRACLVAGGGDVCFFAAAQPVWNGLELIVTGIDECDSYGEAVRALSSCTELDSSAREALTQAYLAGVSAFTSVPPEGRRSAAIACAASLESVRQVGSSAGCKL